MEHFSPLLFGLILVIGRSPQYKVNGLPGPRGMLGINNDRVSRGGCCHLANQFSYISLEVPSPNQFLY